jgi:hypothetical protein
MLGLFFPGPSWYLQLSPYLFNPLYQQLRFLGSDYRLRCACDRNCDLLSLRPASAFHSRQPFTGRCYNQLSRRRARSTFKPDQAVARQSGWESILIVAPHQARWDTSNGPFTRHVTTTYAAPSALCA